MSEQATEEMDTSIVVGHLPSPWTMANLWSWYAARHGKNSFKCERWSYLGCM